MPNNRSSEKRIVIDATAQLSGGRVYLLELLPRLAALMPDVKFEVFGGPTDLPTALDGSPSFTCRRVRVLSDRATLFQALSKWFWRECIFPFRALPRAPAAAVSMANFISPVFNWMGIPSVLCIHNITPFHDPEWYHEKAVLKNIRSVLLRWLTKDSVSRTTTSIVFSEYARNVLLKYSRANPDRVAAIYHGCPENPRPWEGIKSDTLLIVAHYHAYKRIEVAIRAMSLLAQRVTLPIELVVQGRVYDSHYYASLQELVRELGLSNRVVLGTGVDQQSLADYYATSKALLFPSVGENCPITLLEAMKAGLPIIGADFPPIPEICCGAAEYFRESQEESLAEAILQVITSEDRMKQLSNACRERAALLTWEVAAAQTAERLRMVLSENGRG